MNVLFIANNEYSHLTPLFPLLKYLIYEKELNVYIYIGKDKKHVLEEEFSDKLNYLFYDENIFKSNKLLNISEYSKYNGSNYKEVMTIPELVSEFHDMTEYTLRASENYYNNIHHEIHNLNPDIIFRDSCCLFGRKIADEMDCPLIGYTTMLMVPEDTLKLDLKIRLGLILNHDLTSFTDTEITLLKLKLNECILELSAKYSIRSIPINYMSDPGENINFGFGISLDSNEEISALNKSYIYFRHPVFANKYSVSNNETNILISSGNISAFPFWVYESSINSFKNYKKKVFISFKLIELKNLVLNNVPKNVFFKKKLSQKEILENSSLFISHGGYNSLVESIYYKVPLIIIPIQNDQFMNSYFAEKYAISRTVKYNSFCSKTEFNDICESILTDRDVKNNINYLHERFQNEGSNVNAIFTYIEELINN